MSRGEAKMGGATVETLGYTSDMTVAIIGVVGTLLGTILGWGLSTISGYGSLKNYLVEIKEELTHHNVYGAQVCDRIEQVEDYSLTIIMDMYNSSASVKIMRNIRIIFLNNKIKLFEMIPKDLSTERYACYGFISDDIMPINIPPKSINQLNLACYLSKRDHNFYDIIKCNKIQLSYINESNHKRCLKVIQDRCYISVLENSKSE
jgi:hypothetical protein